MKNQHLEPQELEALLFGVANSNEDIELAEHLESCQRCQTKLGEIAAPTEHWLKAAEFIDRSSLSDFSNAIQVQAVEVNPEINKSHGENSNEYSLEPPLHPEMLGRIGDYDIEGGMVGPSALCVFHPQFLGRWLPQAR